MDGSMFKDDMVYVIIVINLFIAASVFIPEHPLKGLLLYSIFTLAILKTVYG